MKIVINTNVMKTNLNKVASTAKAKASNKIANVLSCLGISIVTK